MKIILLLILGLCFVYSQPKDPWVIGYEGFKQAEIKDLDGWVVRKAYKGNTFSQCDKTTLVGGYAAFGRSATALKSVKVPPHYKLKINVQLWKIDSWDNEYMYVFVDGFLWQAKWHYSEGANLCGAANDWKEAFYNIEIIVPHNSPIVNIVLTSNLDEDATNESWGFRDFTLSYLRCPGECEVCTSDKASTCFFWQLMANTWTKDVIGIEGWTLEGEGKPESTDCSGVKMFGGYGKIGRNTKLTKVFDKLPPHFAVLVKMQFWKIDSWDNEVFKMFVDDKERFSQAFAYNEGVDLCGADTGAKQGENWAEKIVNIEFQVPHKFPQAKVMMTSTLDEPPENESWGVRDFLLFVATCYKTCGTCIGPEKADCETCRDGYELSNGECKEGMTWFISSKMFFDNEKDFSNANEWVIQNSFQNKNDQPFSLCGTQKLMGGYMKFGTKATATRVFKLPKHRQIRIKFQMWKVDSWDDEDFQLFVDDKKVYDRKFGFSTAGQSKICGAPQSTWMTFFMNVDHIMEHSANEVKILLTSTLDQAADDESWGFREFMLMYEPVEDCVEFFSECNFKGEKYELCKDTPSLSERKIMQVKSIRLPPGVVIDGFDTENYGGKKVRFSQSQECLGDINFSFIQQSYQIQQVDEMIMVPNLRRLRLD